MITGTHPHSTAAGLLRLVAIYLALVLLLQGMAAAVAMVKGPSHWHRQGPTSVASMLFKHHDHAHADAHAGSERHHHHAADLSVVADAAAEDAADKAALALSAALALLALQTRRGLADPRRHVLHAAPAWSFSTAPSTLPFKPPRQP